MFRIARRNRSSSRRPRGQAIVLAALVSLAIFVAVMLTFAIGHRTREKIKLQALADSSAYGLAVAEARTFNYFAWANRAHVAHDVAVLSVNSHISYISVHEGILNAASQALYIAAGELAAAEAACPFTGLCCMGIYDAKVTYKAGKVFAGSDYGCKKWMNQNWQKSSTSDEALAKAALAHYVLAASMAEEQAGMLVRLGDRILGQSFAKSAANVVDQSIDTPHGADVANGKNLAKVVYWGDGSSGGNKGSYEDWNEIQATTRYNTWVTDRGFVWGVSFAACLTKAEAEMIPQCIMIPNPHDSGNAKTLTSSPGSSWSKIHNAVHKSGKDSIEGWSGPKGYAAEDHGGFGVEVLCTDPCAGVGYWTARGGAVWSDYQNSRHWYLKGNSFKAKSESRHKLGGQKGIYISHPRYRWGPADRAAADNLYDHPHTVALLTKPMPIDGKKQVYDLNFSTTLPVPVTYKMFQNDGDVESGNAMAAIAGGLVYYHKPRRGAEDAWKEPPSFWNPFWRAKLHPVDTRMLHDADLALAGHTESLKVFEELRLGTLMGKDAINY